MYVPTLLYSTLLYSRYSTAVSAKPVKLSKNPSHQKGPAEGQVGRQVGRQAGKQAGRQALGVYALGLWECGRVGYSSNYFCLSAYLCVQYILT